MKLKTVALLGLLLGCFKCFSQKDSGRTELVIIGTIHTGNKFFNHKTLYRVLDKLNPDIILYEHSDSFKPIFGLKIARFLKVAKVSIEQSALQDFSRRHKNTKVFPYDTSFARIKYIKKQIKVEGQLYDKLQLANMSTPDSTSFVNYVIKSNNYYAFFDQKNLFELNDPKTYSIAGELYKDDQELILPLAKQYLSDSTLISEFERNRVFWIDRNNYMVKQIERYVSMFPGKRIVVLTGLNHKYFLMGNLFNRERHDIKLLELK